MLYSPTALFWRQAHNPLRGLTMARVVNMLSSAEQGYYSDLQWLYRFIEKRDAVLRSVLVRRLGAMKKLDWSIKVKEGAKGYQAQETALREHYEGIDNLRQAVEHLALAEFRGFSILEKHWNADGDITHLEPVPQWFWARRLPKPEWFYNPTASNTNMGIPTNPDDFIIREVDNPINEVAVICYMRKNLSQKDWDGFIETYGIPPLFVELPLGVANTGATAVDSTTPYQELAEQVVSDGRGVLPNGAKIQTVSEHRGQNPFGEHLDYQDKQIVMAATGGILTALNDATGLGSGQSDSHEKTFLDIAKGEAKSISEVFQKMVDGPFLKEKFPSQDAMVYFDLHADELDERSVVIDDAQKLAAAGYEVELKQMEEKTGYTLINKADKMFEQQQKAQAAMYGFGGAPADEEADTEEMVNAAAKILDEGDASDPDFLNNALLGMAGRLTSSEKNSQRLFHKLGR